MRVEFEEVLDLKGINYEYKSVADFSDGKGKKALEDLFEDMGDGLREIPITENQRFVTTTIAEKLTGEVEVFATVKPDGSLFVSLQELEED